MRHTEELIDRILYLKGMPQMKALDIVRVGHTVLEQLKLDQELECSNDARIRNAISIALDFRDYGTYALLTMMLAAEEQHIAWLDEQLTLAEQIGTENYLAQQVRDDRDD
jgi:bacterioferritin